MKALQSRLTYANVTATLALVIAVGGASAFAATQLGKNTVGPKQLKKNAVITAKIKNGAVTEAKIAAGAVTSSKVAPGSLTGTQIDTSTLGTVPSAHIATTASVANTASVAKSLTPSENWHVVGAPGEPKFLGTWFSVGVSYGPVSFYKDQMGIVHLKGPAGNAVSGEEIFKLPPGFRPEPGTFLAFPVLCTCLENRLEISGSDGEVRVGGGTSVYLEGVSFRAES